jgi:hypothetical protein
MGERGKEGGACVFVDEKISFNLFRIHDSYPCWIIHGGTCG